MRPVPLAALLTLTALTPARAAPVVEAEPSRLVLGPRARMEITVRSVGPGLRAEVSLGTLTPAASGVDFTRFLWTPPPDARAPTLVLFAFWSGDAPALSDITVLSLPCAGRTELSIDTEPGARVTVEVAGARFGPRRADAQGKLKMPVEVGPQAHEARILAELSDQSKIRVLPLTLPPSPWLLALTPKTSSEGAPVHALLVVPDTEESAGIELVADGARVEREQEAGRRLLARLTPEPSRSAVPVAARTLDGSVRAEATLEVVRAVPPAPVATPPAALPAARWVLGGAVGGFVGGGSNAGAEGSLTLGLGLPRLPLVVELEVGLRVQSLSTQVGALGVKSSSLLVFPVEVAARWEAMAVERFRLGLRGGGGLLVASHHLSSTFDAELTEGALGWELFAAVQAGLQLGPVEPYLEVRGALSKVSTDHLEAHPGGAIFSIGARGTFR